jgi:hypothetical protein
MLVGKGGDGWVKGGEEEHRGKQSGTQHFIDFPVFKKTSILRKRAGARTRCVVRSARRQTFDESWTAGSGKRVVMTGIWAKINNILPLAGIFNNLVTALYHHSRFLCIVVSW